MIQADGTIAFATSHFTVRPDKTPMNEFLSYRVSTNGVDRIASMTRADTSTARQCQLCGTKGAPGHNWRGLLRQPGLGVPTGERFQRIICVEPCRAR
jgi:hypothetical protein